MASVFRETAAASVGWGVDVPDRKGAGGEIEREIEVRNVARFARRETGSADLDAELCGSGLSLTRLEGCSSMVTSRGDELVAAVQCNTLRCGREAEMEAEASRRRSKVGLLVKVEGRHLRGRSDCIGPDWLTSHLPIQLENVEVRFAAAS